MSVIYISIYINEPKQERCKIQDHLKYSAFVSQRTSRFCPRRQRKWQWGRRRGGQWLENGERVEKLCLPAAFKASLWPPVNNRSSPLFKLCPFNKRNSSVQENHQLVGPLGCLHEFVSVLLAYSSLGSCFLWLINMLATFTILTFPFCDSSFLPSTDKIRLLWPFMQGSH